MKNLIVLALLAALLGGAAYMMSKSEEAAYENAAVQQCEVFGGAVTSGTLMRMEIRQPNQKPVDLVCVNDYWFVESGTAKFKADAAAVERVTLKLQDPINAEIVANEAAVIDNYELGDTSATRVLLHTKNNGTQDWLLGKAGANYTSSYARKADSNEVVLAETNLSNMFNSPDGWRDRMILQIGRDTITSIKAEGTTATFTLNQTGGEWALEGRDGAVNKEKLDLLLNAISSLRANDFEADETAEAATKLGFDTPHHKLTITYEDKMTAPGAEQTVTLLFGNHDTLRNLARVKVADEPALYIIGDLVSKQMLPDAKDLTTTALATPAAEPTE